MKIFLFAASHRKFSLNRKLLEVSVEHLKSHPGVQTELTDFRDFLLPIYDGDLEESSGIPAEALKLTQKIREAQALIIAAPEYNAGISGAFKNAIDWVSRSRPIAFTKKPICLMGASPGGFAAVRGLWHTRIPLEALGAYVYPPMFGLGTAHQAFEPSGKFTDPKNLTKLEDLLQGFLEFAKALS